MRWVVADSANVEEMWLEEAALGRQGFEFRETCSSKLVMVRDFWCLAA